MYNLSEAINLTTKVGSVLMELSESNFEEGFKEE